MDIDVLLNTVIGMVVVVFAWITTMMFATGGKIVSLWHQNLTTIEQIVVTNIFIITFVITVGVIAKIVEIRDK